jgi:hypothetical protein
MVQVIVLVVKVGFPKKVAKTSLLEVVLYKNP